MSADNGIYTLRTPKGNGFEYRVAHLQAIDNLEWDDEAINPNDGSKGWYNGEPDHTIKNARLMFENAPVFTTEKEALEAAFELESQIHYCEYGMCYLEIDREF